MFSLRQALPTPTSGVSSTCRVNGCCIIMEMDVHFIWIYIYQFFVTARAKLPLMSPVECSLSKNRPNEFISAFKCNHGALENQLSIFLVK